MLWMFAALSAAFLLAIVNTADKFVLTAWIKPRILILIIGGMQSIIALSAISISGLDPLPPALILLSVLTGMLFLAYVYLILTGIKGEEVSRVLPFLYTYPLIVLPLSVAFLGETLTSTQYWGVFIIIGGALLASVRENALPHFNRSVCAALSGALIFGMYSVLLKYLVSFADFWSIFFYTRLGILLITSMLLFLQRSELTATIQTNKRSSLGIVLSTEILAAIALYLHTWATDLGPVSLVSALYATRPIFVFILATSVTVFAPHLFREQLSPKTVLIKVSAILLTTIGVILTAI